MARRLVRPNGPYQCCTRNFFRFPSREDSNCRLHAAIVVESFCGGRSCRLLKPTPKPCLFLSFSSSTRRLVSRAANLGLLAAAEKGRSENGNGQSRLGEVPQSTRGARQTRAVPIVYTNKR